MHCDGQFICAIPYLLAKIDVSGGYLALFEHRHVFLQCNVFLLQLAVVLQQTSLTEFVLLDVITESGPLQLYRLTVL